MLANISSKFLHLTFKGHLHSRKRKALQLIFNIINTNSQYLKIMQFYTIVSFLSYKVYHYE